MATLDNQQIQDPSTKGIEGIKGLEGINRLKEKGINIDTSIFNLANDYRGTMNEINQSATPRQNIGFVGINDSMFDDEITSASQLDNLSNTRGELQPWYAQISAGLAKGVVLAGTTFLDGTVGLLFGGVQAIEEKRFSALWDNPFSKAMQSINEWSKKVLPNYYTDAERNEPWYENIFTANFLGDKFIKNLGFTVGAFYGGNLGASILKGGMSLAQGTKIGANIINKSSNLAKTIGIVKDASQFPAMVTSGVGSVISAVNEGRIEALNNSTDWFNLQKAKLDNTFGITNDDISHLSDIELSVYTDTLNKISENRLKMGNSDLLMNIPILTASNLIQFGRMYANGFKTARKATNIVDKAGEYATGRTTGKGIAKTLLSPLSEGTEEISQKAVATISGLAYEQDVNNFYKAKINPEAEQQTIDWIKAFAQGINETVNDGSSWEEFFIGTLTGALGMPRFRGIRSSEGKVQSPITLEEGVVGKFKEYKKQMKRDAEIADYMNARVQSPEFKNYYQGLIRHNKYQNDMNQAVENNDEFEFKNAEHAQLISDIAMFDNAGKLEDLKTLIASAYDTSDENIASIIENTTSVLDNGDLAGPFAEFAIKNEDGTILANISNKESKEEVIKKITKNKDDIFNTIKQYQTIKDNIDIRIGQQLSDEQLEELTWLKSQIGNWQDRANQLSSEIKSTISTLIGSMSELADRYNFIKNEEGKEHAELSDIYKKADKNEITLRKNISTLQFIRSLSDKVFAYTLSKDSKLVQDIKSAIEDPNNGINTDEVQTINNKIDDIVKLVNATNKYNTKLKEYLENPSKLQEDIISSTENIAKEEVKKKSDDLKSKLVAATNLSEFRQALNEEENLAIRAEAFKSLEEEGNEMAKNYREVNSYNNDIQKIINSLDESPEIKLGALKLFQNQFENSSNLKEIANPNSTHINNKDILYDDKLTSEENTKKFQEAQYALLKAMNQINNDNKFKDRFSKEYRELKTNINSNLSNNKKDTTDDNDNTDDNTDDNNIYKSSFGNVTSTEINEENKQLNNEVETPQSLDDKYKDKRPYYRPAIPELHIEASKEGDFRPFNKVVVEREKGVNFDVLYNYLEKEGAFTYVNEGNLKIGDEIGFMIDPVLEEQMKVYSWYKGPTILLIDKKNNQVVGSLDEKQSSVNKYEGLASLREKIIKEYHNNTDKDKFIATPITKVSKIMVGKIPYGTEERSLAKIFEKTKENKTPIFGIIKNGILDTNKDADNKINYDDIIKPVDMSNKEGRMYLLIPNAAGKYSPAAVRIKHFNRTEFNPENVEVQNTQVYKNIQESINLLANSMSEYDLNKAVESLSTNLYTGNLHIDWFTSDKGNGIRFKKVYRDAEGNEIYEEKNGNRERKEDERVVFLTEKWDQNTLYSIIGNGEIITEPTLKNIDDVSKEIMNILLDFNLPIQVDLGKLNRGGYNSILINSNVLTSNISEAKVIDNWFTTDYIDSEGNLHKAINPISIIPKSIKKVETPVGGKEGIIKGTKVVLDNITYHVDLTTNKIYDSNNKRIYPKNTELITDIAWANANFGDATEGSLIWDNKILVSSGKVLDRGTNKYLKGKAAQKAKNEITNKKKTIEANKEKNIENSKKVLSQIAENQKKVDKTKTDSEFYYILEEDGQYHKYERVHSRLGNNWVESKKQTEVLKDIKLKLFQLSDNITKYNDYLKNLSNYWKVDLSTFNDKVDAKSRDTIVNIIRDSMNGTNSQGALNAGTAVDNVIRNFFISNDTSVKPDNMNSEAFSNLITSLTEIRSNIEARGERFLTNNIVLFQKYPDGTRIAGEVDILSVDAEGKFRIYDVKTGRYSFHNFTDKYGNQVNYFLNPSATQKISTKDYYTLQLSAYKNLFESQYNTPITTLAILPFVLNYNKNNRNIVEEITKEDGIIITYNPAVNVPLVNNVKVDESIPNNSSLPIFNSTFEIQNPINNVLPEYSLEGSKIGYFVKEGKLYKSYLTSIGKINGIDMHMAKIPNITKGYGNSEARVASNTYIAVFPNGNSIAFINNDPLTLTEQQAKDIIKQKLEGNPQRVVDMSNEETFIFNPASINNTDTSKGALLSIKKTQAANEHDDEYEDDLKLFRKVDELNTIWDKEKELEWIKKVLPKLVEEDRVKMVEGLIRAGEHGELAWGQFDGSIITLSDIAAEGTTYHEAFHVVFNLLLDQNERTSLLNEYRKKHPNMDNLSLEEELAEDFREFVIQGGKDTRSLGRKIIDFFKSLFIKTKYWKDFRPSSIYYFKAINDSKYSKENIPFTTSNNNKYKQEEYTQEMKDILAKAPRDSQGRLLAPNGKPSNLTERQYAQVRTKAFKDWFGDWERTFKQNEYKPIDSNNVFKHSLFRGQAAIPEIDKNGNLHLRTSYDSLSKLKTLSFASKEKEALHYGYRAAKNPYIIELNEDYLDNILPKEEYERDKVENKKPFRYNEEFNEVRLSFNDEIIIPKGQYSISHNEVSINIDNVEDAKIEVFDLINLMFSSDAQEYNGVSELKGAISKQDIKERYIKIKEIIGEKFYDIISISEASKDHTGRDAYYNSKNIQKYINEGYLIKKDYDLFTEEDLKVNPPKVIEQVKKEWAYYELTDKANKEINKIIKENKNNNSVSKVVDENGEPLVVYHSSTESFEEFKHGVKDNTGAKDTKNMFYFSSNKSVSSWYTDMLHGFNKYTSFNTVELENKLLSKLTEGKKPIYSEHDYDGEMLYSIYPNGVVIGTLISQVGFSAQILEINDTSNSKFFNSLPRELQDDFLDNIVEHFDKELAKDILELSEYNYEQSAYYDESAGVALDAKRLDPNIIDKYFIRSFFLNIKDIEEIKDYEGKVKHSIIKNIEENQDKDGFVIINTNDSGTNILSDIYVVREANQIKSATDNIGTFDSNNPDIRYKKIPSIKELRAQEKSMYDKYNNDIEEEYREAVEIVNRLNYKRFNTPEEAMNAFNESGIRKDFFYRITRAGANNAVGYKIQLITRAMLEQYKIDNNPYSENYEDYTPVENFYFDSLDPEIQMMLFDKGWTKEEFDSISQEERDVAVECIYF